MNISMICVSEKGIERAVLCRRSLGQDNAIQIFVKSRFAASGYEDIRRLKETDSLDMVVRQGFEKSECIVFFCAVGIAVRLISACVQSKATDPAVLCIDEAGRYCIPILSGHLGGANQMAKVLSDILGTMPVITTATDAMEVFSPDMFAVENGLTITDLAMAKVIAAASVRGEKIGIWIDEVWAESVVISASNAVICEEKECGQHSYGIMISDRRFEPLFANTLRLYPKKLVVGIGCRRDTLVSVIKETVEAVFDKYGYCTDGINAIVSIDIKKEEQGLIELSRQLKVPFITYSKEKLKEQEEKYGREHFSVSAFVEEKTGVGCVCECALLAYGAREILVKKQAVSGVTVAIGVM